MLSANQWLGVIKFLYQITHYIFEFSSDSIWNRKIESWIVYFDRIHSFYLHAFESIHIVRI